MHQEEETRLGASAEDLAAATNQYSFLSPSQRYEREEESPEKEESAGQPGEALRLLVATTPPPRCVRELGDASPSAAPPQQPSATTAHNDAHNTAHNDALEVNVAQVAIGSDGRDAQAMSDAVSGPLVSGSGDEQAAQPSPLPPPLPPTESIDNHTRASLADPQRERRVQQFTSENDAETVVAEGQVEERRLAFEVEASRAARRTAAAASSTLALSPPTLPFVAMINTSSSSSSSPLSGDSTIASFDEYIDGESSTDSEESDDSIGSIGSGSDSSGRNMLTNYADSNHGGGGGGGGGGVSASAVAARQTKKVKATLLRFLRLRSLFFLLHRAGLIYHATPKPYKSSQRTVVVVKSDGLTPRTILSSGEVASARAPTASCPTLVLAGGGAPALNVTQVRKGRVLGVDEDLSAVSSSSMPPRTGVLPSGVSAEALGFALANLRRNPSDLLAGPLHGDVNVTCLEQGAAAGAVLLLGVGDTALHVAGSGPSLLGGTAPESEHVLPGTAPCSLSGGVAVPLHASLRGGGEAGSERRGSGHGHGVHPLAWPGGVRSGAGAQGELFCGAPPRAMRTAPSSNFSHAGDCSVVVDVEVFGHGNRTVFRVVEEVKRVQSGIILGGSFTLTSNTFGSLGAYQVRAAPLSVPPLPPPGGNASSLPLPPLLECRAGNLTPLSTGGLLMVLSCFIARRVSAAKKKFAKEGAEGGCTPPPTSLAASVLFQGLAIQEGEHDDAAGSNDGDAIHDDEHGESSPRQQGQSRASGDIGSGGSFAGVGGGGSCGGGVGGGGVGGGGGGFSEISPSSVWYLRGITAEDLDTSDLVICPMRPWDCPRGSSNSETRVSTVQERMRMPNTPGLAPELLEMFSWTMRDDPMPFRLRKGFNYAGPLKKNAAAAHRNEPSRRFTRNGGGGGTESKKTRRSRATTIAATNPMPDRTSRRLRADGDDGGGTNGNPIRSRQPHRVRSPTSSPTLLRPPVIARTGHDCRPGAIESNEGKLYKGLPRPPTSTCLTCGNKIFECPNCEEWLDPTHARRHIDHCT